jgi:hypothetical protein
MQRLTGQCAARRAVDGRVAPDTARGAELSQGGLPKTTGALLGCVSCARVAVAQDRACGVQPVRALWPSAVGSACVRFGVLGCACGLLVCQQPWSQVVWGLQVYACDPRRRATQTLSTQERRPQSTPARPDLCVTWCTRCTNLQSCCKASCQRSTQLEWLPSLTAIASSNRAATHARDIPARATPFTTPQCPPDAGVNLRIA